VATESEDRSEASEAESLEIIDCIVEVILR
jgi:hypothetical protein